MFMVKKKRDTKNTTDIKLIAFVLPSPEILEKKGRYRERMTGK